MAITKALFTTAEAAEFIGYSKSTLETWRSRGRKDGAPMPRFIKQGDAVRYRYEDLVAFANEETVVPHLKAVASNLAA